MHPGLETLDAVGELPSKILLELAKTSSVRRTVLRSGDPRGASVSDAPLGTPKISRQFAHIRKVALLAFMSLTEMREGRSK